VEELLFFDKSIFNVLSKVEQYNYNTLMQNVVIPEGRPFFLGDNGLPVRELDGFCNYLLGPARESSKTWKTYAIPIAVYLRFMRAQGKCWKEAKEKDLDLYYTVRITGEFQSSPPLKKQSWNVAKTAIVHLYEYALDEGLIEKVPFKYRKSKAQFGKKQTETADLGAKFTPEPINFISLTHYKSIWRPLLAKGENSQRNLALTELLVSSGLRISEALGLHIHQIPDPDSIAYVGRKSITIRVVGKGKKPRYVRIPKRIIRAIRFYTEEDREAALDNFRKMNSTIIDLTTKVFLSRVGNPMSARAVQSFFKNISKTTGIKLTPHGCRHTYAVYQLEAMIKRMAKNLKELKATGADVYRQILNDPLRELQKLLGHSSISSTYIYLDFLEEAEALVDESLADWTNWGNENGR